MVVSLVAVIVGLGVMLIALPFAAAVVRPVNVVLTRAALNVFGGHVESVQSREERLSGVQSTRLGALRGAHVAQTYRVYSSKTLLYALIIGIGVAILGVGIVKTVAVAVGISPAAVRATVPPILYPLTDGLTQPTLSTTEAIVVFTASSLTLGALSAAVVHTARWWWPSYKARERARRIDASMERTIAFVYALSRSGMAFPKVMDVLAQNRRVYGEAAREVQVAVRDMDTFNADLVGALERLNKRTPSDNMAEFTENLISVLRSGRNLGTFLRDQYDRYREESEAQQERFLELLATLAEAYVTVLVAGPLFLITTLVILGLVMGGTLPFLRMLAYGLIPLATVGFMIYLDSLDVTSSLRAEATELPAALGSFLDVRKAESTDTVPDGGTVDHAINRGRLEAYNNLRGLRERARDPFGYLVRNPTGTFWVTVPIALAYVLYVPREALGQWLNFILLTGGQTLALELFPLEALDDLVIQGLIFVLGSFAVVYEIRQRQLRRIEAVMPDFLDRLASANEAGMPVVGSLRRVTNSDLGALNEEMSRTWLDVRWGTSVQAALHRFERRVKTPTVTRATTLITNAMRASGDLGPVLRIAADEAQASRRLQLQRRQELLTYVVVIYVSFFVFLTIIVALSIAFIPAIPAPADFGQRVSAGFGGIPVEQKEALQLVFFHTVIIQALCSGLVAGQMGQGSVKDGAKHATVMLLIGYVVFLFVG